MSTLTLFMTKCEIGPRSKTLEGEKVEDFITIRWPMDKTIKGAEVKC